MIFGIEETIAYLSQGTTLERGSLIMTGTPPGIGMLRNPKVVLRQGDDMRVEIEGIGWFFFFFVRFSFLPLAFAFAFFRSFRASSMCKKMWMDGLLIQSGQAR